MCFPGAPFPVVLTQCRKPDSLCFIRKGLASCFTHGGLVSVPARTKYLSVIKITCFGRECWGCLLVEWKWCLIVIRVINSTRAEVEAVSPLLVEWTWCLNTIRVTNPTQHKAGAEWCHLVEWEAVPYESPCD